MNVDLVPLATLRITIARQTRIDGVPAGARLIGEAATCELQGERVRASQGAALPVTGAPVYVTPTFETDDAELAWLNTIQAVGKGIRDGSELVYEFYELA